MLLARFNHEAFKYLLAQTTAEALMKLGIRATLCSMWGASLHSRLA